MAEVDDGVVLHRCAQHFFYQPLRSLIYGCASLDVDDFAEETDDEVAQLALVFCQSRIVFQFFLDVSADGEDFLVQVFRQSVDGIVHEFVEMETHVAYRLAKSHIHCLALIGLQIFHDARNKTGGGWQSERGIDSCAKHEQGKGMLLRAKHSLGKLVAKEYLVLRGSVGSYLVGAVLHVYRCFTHDLFFLGVLRLLAQVI